MVSQSAAAAPYLAPPPSTLVGALAYAVAVRKGLPECVSVEGKVVSTAWALYDAVKWAAFGVEEGFHSTSHMDLVRSFRLIYQRGARHSWEYKDMWFGVCGHGRVYACRAPFKVLYLVDERLLSRGLGMSLEDLARTAYGVCRIGSRESLVSIHRVSRTRTVKVVEPPVRTDYYFPRRLVLNYVPSTVELTPMPPLRAGALELRPSEPLMVHDHEEYVLPLKYLVARVPERVEVRRLSREGACIVAVFNGRREVIVVPREVAAYASG